MLFNYIILKQPPEEMGNRSSSPRQPQLQQERQPEQDHRVVVVPASVSTSGDEDDSSSSSSEDESEAESGIFVDDAFVRLEFLLNFLKLLNSLFSASARTSEDLDKLALHLEDKRKYLKELEEERGQEALMKETETIKANIQDAREWTFRCFLY